MPDINASMKPAIKPETKPESKDTATPEISVDEALVQEIQKRVDSLNQVLVIAADRKVNVKIEMTVTTTHTPDVTTVRLKVLDIWKQLKPSSVFFVPR